MGRSKFTKVAVLSGRERAFYLPDTPTRISGPENSRKPAMRAAMVSCPAARYAARSATGMRNALRCIQTSRIPREPRNSRMLAYAVSTTFTVAAVRGKCNELLHKVPGVRC